MKCGHQEYYVMRFWIVIALFPLTFYDMTLAGERFVLPWYCHAWIEVHVLHSASMTSEDGGCSLNYFWVEVKFPTPHWASDDTILAGRHRSTPLLFPMCLH